MSPESLISNGVATPRKTVFSLLESGDILLVQDGNHGGNYPAQSDFVEFGGIPLVTGADIERGFIDIKGSKQITSGKASDLRVGIAKEGDLLLTHKGTMGKTAIVPPVDTPFIVVNPQITIYRVNPSGSLSTRFLKYFFDSPEFQEYLNRISSTSTVSTLSITNQKSLEIPCPSIESQNRISSILGTLDDKIELNRKTEETLKEIAKALFKSWFVDFDPVRAKAERRHTGLPDEISELFPDSFEESELGEIPQNWKPKTFGDFTTARRGRIITRKDTAEGKVPVVAGGMTPAYFHNISNVDGPVVTISASGANAGFVNLYFESIWASDCSYISKTESEFPFTCYLFLKVSQDRIYDAQHGGVQPHINPGDIGRLDFAIAEKQVCKCFEEIISPIFFKIESTIKESRYLECLRDALLPRLISGELRVPDAEKMLEEVGI